MSTSTSFPSSVRLALLLCLLAEPAMAQSIPDAGSLSRETERNLEAPRAVEPQRPAAAAQPVPQDENAPRVAVQRISIQGATLIPLEELQALVQESVGKSLTLAELEQAAQRVAQHYRERGWYVRVFLPQQDVTDGHIRIQVLEGRFGASQLGQQNGERADAERVRQLVTNRLQAGAPLSAAALERGLLLANDLPGIEAQGLLQAGQSVGHSDLQVVVHDTPLVTGDIGLNNFGNRSTGRAQAVGGLALNNLTGIGDQLGLRLLGSEGIRSVVGRYSLPLGHDGLRLAAHASLLRYELGGNFGRELEGKSSGAGLTLSYPLVRQGERNVTLSLGYEHRRYSDDALSQPLRLNRINALTLGMNGDLRDGLGGGGLSWAGADLTQGSLNIRDIEGSRAQDAAGPRSAGSYTKLALQLGRLQWLGAGWQVQAALSGQVANGNLVSSERMTLGGPSQVRAYPINEADGDSGVLLKLELQRELGSGWRALAFYDAGRIRQHRRPGPAGTVAAAGPTATTSRAWVRA
ncbi:ShlB/FhaC/HecB family hemolysin secretion/activation protein [Comamonas endophytica]|uniref:ShlB/FhaC/HecB family hemolysin secretion/activation protein n=1 Tax=Comamonas endophytica TaxID=2949090 RepID=UPI003617F9C4